MNWSGRFLPLLGPRHRALEYPLALGVVGLVSAVASLLEPYLAQTDSVMLYLLGVLAVAFWARRGPALLAVVASVAAFDLLFVDPRYTFIVSDTRYLLTFVVMAVVGLVVGALVTEVRDQARLAVEREQQTAILFRLTKTLAVAGEADIERVASWAIADLLDVDAALSLLDADGAMRVVYRTTPEAAEDRDATSARGRAETLALEGRQGSIGLLSMRARGSGGTTRAHATSETIEAIGSLVAMAIERAQGERARQQAELSAAAERLRSALLASVSHDLRTPLGAILGSVTTLEHEPGLDESVRVGLLAGIHEQAEHLDRLLRNLLEMTRLEGDGVRLRPELVVVEEPIGSVLAALSHRVAQRRIEVRLAADEGPMFAIFDPIALELVLSNLLENALRYGADPIEILVEREQEVITVRVRDRGPGLDASTLRHAFEKFHRGTNAPAGGAGLGLAIVRILVEASGGRVWARNRDEGGGAELGFTLPSAERPELPDDGEVDGQVDGEARSPA